MIRKIITIDQERCDGCGLCVTACHEGAITLKDGKACLLRDDYCDGLGDCLPACPQNAISFEEREALPYDEAAVQANIPTVQQTNEQDQATQNPLSLNPLACGCPGAMARTFDRKTASPEAKKEAVGSPHKSQSVSMLRQWPVQIRLATAEAPYFSGADLLVAADCTAYAYAAFHEDFMRDKVTLIGCPKLDPVDYATKLTDILQRHAVQSLTILRMSVPCCSGIEQVAYRAIKASGRAIPLQVVTIDTEGGIVQN